MEKHFKGRFITTENDLVTKLNKTRAFVFDWDGVFNSGEKNELGCSFFNEVDSIGTNLLRFNYYLRRNSQCYTAIITGENNKSSLQFAEREHFNSVYYGAKNKKKALEHFCHNHELKPEEIVFVFDDVPDLEVASMVGLRIMVGRQATTRLQELAIDKGWVYYITSNDGGDHAIRELSELLLSLLGNYEEPILQRAHFSPAYQAYFSGRNALNTEIFGPEEF